MHLAGSATKRVSRTYWSPDRRKRRHRGKGRSSRAGPARLSRFLEGAEFVLKRQGHTLQRPEDGHGTEKDKRRPPNQMDPCRRRQGQCQQQRQTDNDGADHEDAEDGRTVAGVVPAEPEAADPTPVRYFQKPVKQAPTPKRGQRPRIPSPISPAVERVGPSLVNGGRPSTPGSRSRPTSRPTRTGRATPRRRNASTRRRPRSPRDGRA